MMYHLSEQNRIVHLLLLVLFSLPLTPTWGQSWETAYEENFQQAIQANELSDVANLVQSNNSFHWAKRGSTGTNNDICARKIFQNNQYIGFQLALETGFEYRLSWNVKTLLEAKALDFKVGTDAASAELISGPHAIPVVGANSEPGTVVTSDIFTVAANGMYVLIVRPSDTSTGTTGQTRFDDFTLEKRTLSTPTSFSFSLSSQAVQEGNTVDICVDADNTFGTTAAQIDVALSGNAAPHFLSYSSQTISVPAGFAGQECISISVPEIPAEDGEVAYQFLLINPQGGLNATVEGTPVLSLTVSDASAVSCDWGGPDQTICDGESVTIGQNWEAEGHPECWADDYCVRWFPEDGIETTNSNLQITVAPNQTTLYILYITDSNGNLVGTDEVLVTVLDMGTPHIEPAAPVICNGGFVTLSTYILGDEDAYTFSWSNGDSGTSATVTEPGMYTVTATDNATNCTKETSVEVTALDFSVSINGESSEICAGSSTELTAEVSGGSASYSYTWSNGASEATITVLHPGTYDVTVTGPDPTCEATASFTVNEQEGPAVQILGGLYDLIQSTENPPEAVDLAPLPTVQPYCPGQTFVLDVAGDFTSVAWEGSVFSNGNIPGASPHAVVFIPNGPVIGGGDTPSSDPTVTLTLTYANGCTSETTVTFVEAADNPAGVQQFLAAKGFYCIDVAVLGPVALRDDDANSRDVDGSPCEDVDCPANTSGCVRDEAGLSFSIDGEAIDDPKALFENFLAYFEEEYGYPHTRAIITKDENLCACNEGDGFLTEVEHEFEEGELFFWVNISEELGKLCMLANVPTNETHHPVEAHRKTFLEAVLAIAADDEGTGNLGSEAEQQFFALADGLLDNYTSTITPQADESAGNSNNPYLCNNALFTYPIVLAPSGIPMALPQYSSLSWIFEDKWQTKVANGALAGFTDWSEVENLEAEKPKYYIGRFDLGTVEYYADEALLLPERFKGYYQYATIRDVSTSNAYYFSEQPDPFPPTVLLGELQGDNSGVVISAGLYQENPIPLLIYPNPGYGQVYIADNFQDPPAFGGNAVISPLPDVPSYFEFPSIGGIATEIQPTFEPIFEEGNTTIAGYLFTIHYDNGQSDYILASLDLAGEITAYLWNCTSGSYDIPFDILSLTGELFFELQGTLTGLTYNSSYLLSNTPSLGTPFSIDLSPSEAQALGFTYEVGSTPWTENEADVVANYGQLSEEAVNALTAEAQRVFEWGDEMQIQYVTSADENLVELVDGGTLPSYSGSPGKVFVQNPLSRADVSLPDAKILMHFREDGGVYMSIRIAPDQFDNIQADFDGDGVFEPVILDQEQKQLTQITTLESWENGIRSLAAGQLTGNEVGDCSITDDCPDNDPNPDSNPWGFALRENAPELNGTTLTGEMLAILGDFSKDAELNERMWRGGSYNAADANKRSLFEVIEAGCGVGNAVVAENPLAGFYQLAVFGYSFMKDDQTRTAIINALKDPVKLAKNLYEDKRSTYFGSDIEKKLYHASYDAVSTVFLLFNVATLTTKIKGLGKAADQSAKKIGDEVGLKDDADFADLKNQLLETNGFSDLEIEQFWQYMGESNFSLPNRQKLLKNPWLIRWWKKFKDDFGDGFCDIGGLQGDDPQELFFGPGEGGQSFRPILLPPPSCVNFDDFVRQLPEPPATEFMDKLRMTFPETPEGMSKAADFIGDTQITEGNVGTQFFDQVKANPQLVDAWDALFVRNVPNLLRTNTKFLNRLSGNPNLVNYVDNLTEVGKLDLTNNLDEWVKRYDARTPLKNGNILDAVNTLGGSLGAPKIYNGANYVDELTPSQVTKFDNIANSTTDVAQVASNLGLSENVIQTMKQHLFVNEHLIEVIPGTFIQGRFATFEHIADWWNAVKSGNLTNASELKKLISHEYIEAKLMQEGMIYRTLDTPSAAKYGAHELSSHEDFFNFSHWNDLGRNLPGIDLDSNLGNIDDVVNQIKTIEGL